MEEKTKVNHTLENIGKHLFFEKKENSVQNKMIFSGELSVYAYKKMSCSFSSVLNIVLCFALVVLCSLFSVMVFDYQNGQIVARSSDSMLLNEAGGDRYNNVLEKTIAKTETKEANDSTLKEDKNHRFSKLENRVESSIATMVFLSQSIENQKLAYLADLVVKDKDIMVLFTDFLIKATETNENYATAFATAFYETAKAVAFNLDAD